MQLKTVIVRFTNTKNLKKAFKSKKIISFLFAQFNFFPYICNRNNNNIKQ